MEAMQLSQYSDYAMGWMTGIQFLADTKKGFEYIHM
jgi:hypothetical protein